MDIKIGLALGGGGARGSYQIGILQGLSKYGILDQIHHVSGTSIGAINTLMITANLSIERMYEVWDMITNEEIYGQGLDRFKLDKLGLFSIQDLAQKLSREISIDEVRNSKIQGYATAAKLKKQRLIDQILIHRMKKEVFHLNEMEEPYKGVLASASIPVLFGSTNVDDQTYVDGGAVDNCPIEPLIEAGCNVIIAVPIDGMFKSKKYKDKHVLLINLEPHHLFKLLAYDILDFRPEIVKKNADYGQKLFDLMIEKLKNENLFQDKTFNYTGDRFIEVRLSKNEEQPLKDLLDATDEKESS